MKKSLVLIISCLILICVNSINFSVKIQQYTRQCFSQYLMQNTPFHFKAISTHGQSNFELTVLLNNTKIIDKKNKQNSKQPAVRKLDSYSAVSDRYFFCIQNMGKSDNFDISFYNAVELSDLTAFPQEQQKNLINKYVDDIAKVYTTVKQQQHFSIQSNQYNMELQKSVSFKAVGFGFLSITVVLIISFLHYMEIKRVLRNRKVI